MNYTLMPTLERIALVRTVIMLWNKADVNEKQMDWQETEDKVIEKIQELLMPESLKIKALGIVKPIGMEILNWKRYHKSLFWVSVTNLKMLCWEQLGTVDKKKTVEVLIADENINIQQRYQLACIYCLKDDITRLWNEMPENYRRHFYCHKEPRNVKHQELVVFWTYYIRGEVEKMDRMIKTTWRRCTPYQYAFECAIASGNKAAVEYFFQKLTPWEREGSLLRFTGYAAKVHYNCVSRRIDFPKLDYSKVLCFLLSKMDEEQQVEVFQRHPHEVLKCFLDWPWQDFFMATARRTKVFITVQYFQQLLYVIVAKVKDGYKDYNYQKLFGEFWQQSSTTHKQYVIYESAKGELLSKLFQIQDIENIRLLLKDATTAERERIIFFDKGKRICESLMYNGKLDLLAFFIQECISSKDIMIKFKEQFEIRISHRSKETLKGETDIWNNFFQLLDDLLQIYDKKRRRKERDSSLPKKHHSSTSAPI